MNKNSLKSVILSLAIEQGYHNFCGGQKKVPKAWQAQTGLASRMSNKTSFMLFISPETQLLAQRYVSIVFASKVDV